MRYDWLDEYLLAKRGVTKDLQAEWNWVRYQIGGKMFAALCLGEDDRPVYINLKLDPAEGRFFREQYEDVIPGCYSNKEHWNSVNPDGAVPDNLLREMLDKSYRLVLEGFSKTRQREIVELSVCGADCTACGFFEKECSGCTACDGKVFHAPAGKACPIFACCARKKRLASCGGCPEAPCEIWRATRDPAFSDAAFEETVARRMKNLQMSSN